MIGINDPGLVGSFWANFLYFAPWCCLRPHGCPADSSHSTHRALTTQLKRQTPTHIVCKEIAPYHCEPACVFWGCSIYWLWSCMDCNCGTSFYHSETSWGRKFQNWKSRLFLGWPIDIFWGYQIARIFRLKLLYRYVYVTQCKILNPIGDDIWGSVKYCR